MKWVSYTRAISSKIGDENPPDVIGRQNAHIEKYMREHDFKLSKKYSDRKYSADEVEAFNLMVQDGMKRDFDGIVVDSVFRCGKDLWTAEEILSDTFYPAGIHFAVVEDDFCSIGKEKDEVKKYFSKKRGEWISRNNARRVEKQKNDSWQPSLLGKRIYSKETGIALRSITLENGERVYACSKSDLDQKINHVPCEAVHMVVTSSIATAIRQARYIDRLLCNGDGENLKEAELEVMRVKARYLFDRMNDLYLERMEAYRSSSGSVTEEVEKSYQEQFAKCEEQFKAVMDEVEIIRKAFSIANPWVALFKEVELPEILAHEDIVKWIDTVLVDNENNIEVNLKKAEWMNRLPKEWLQEGAKE